MKLRESLDYISYNSCGIEKKKQKLQFLVIALKKKRKVKVKLTVKLQMGTTKRKDIFVQKNIFLTIKK